MPRVPSASRTTIRGSPATSRSEEHTSELQSHVNIVCRLLLEKKQNTPSLYFRQKLCELFGMSAEELGLVLSPSELSPSTTSPLVFLASSFFFNDTAATEIYTLSLHDALPI